MMLTLYGCVVQMTVTLELLRNCNIIAENGVVIRKIQYQCKQS